MQPNFDEMKELERRLAACSPAADGLSADAMLFASGRASAQRGLARVIWPLGFTGLSVLTLALAFLWLNERQERIALASQVRPAPALPLSPDRVEPALEEYHRSPGNILEVHRALEQGRDPLPAEPVIYVGASGPSPAPDILRADSLNHMLDP